MITRLNIITPKGDRQGKSRCMVQVGQSPMLWWLVGYLYGIGLQSWAQPSGFVVRGCFRCYSFTGKYDVTLVTKNITYIYIYLFGMPSDHHDLFCLEPGSVNLGLASSHG